jgi:dihydrofolate reductase
MSIRCSVFIAMSVDGFIARPDGETDWLHKPEYASAEGGGFGYTAFMSSIDAMVIGRKTFEKVLSFPTWPYKDMPVVVLSSQELRIPDMLRGKVTTASGSPGEVVSQLATEGKQHLYIDGGVTIQRFLQAKLIHDLTLTQIPVLLGSGIPLFGTIGLELSLRLLETKGFDNGFVQSRYQVVDAT